MISNMPGSLLSSQDVHSDHSDASFRSADSRTSGKKVSFNKAVRVKQYPWHPEESHDVQGSPLLSGRRFWFKVYKNNSNPPPQQNAWKKTDRPAWVEANAEDLHDSLTPIAEDEDGSDGEDPDDAFNANMITRSMRTFDGNGNCFNGHPLDPPIDYIDEEPLFSHIKRQSLLKLDPAKPEIDRNKQEQRKSRFKFIDKKSPGFDLRKNKVTNGGFTSPVKSSDFRRPTISSTAKSSVDKPAKQSLINVRLPRAVAKESTTDKRKESISSSQRLRERRSRSNDDNLNTDRFLDRTEKLDKAVSTEDLSTNSRAFEENGKRNGYWGSPTQQKNKDKATQCTGTLTNYAKSNLNIISSVSRSTRPAFPSTFTQSEIGNTIPSKRDADKNGHTSLNGTDLKQLSLHGKNCISSVSRNGIDKVPDVKTGRTENSARYGASNDNKPNIGRFEYDYVYDASSAANSKRTDLRQQQKTDHQSFIRDENDSLCKPSSWRSMVDNSFCTSSVIPNDNDTVVSGQRFNRADNLRSSSVIGHVCGKHIPLSPNQQHMPSPAIRRIKVANSGESRKNIPSNENGYRLFEGTCAERNSAPSKGRISGVDDMESPIDWSMSGFRLSARSDNNLSSSSDSECVIHRRPPLLMYIPGVSHHHRPAVEDDRLSALSGMSRSEFEDDLSPFSLGARSEFQRRYSMPRNGKLNFLKWKTSKKLMK